MIPGWCRVALLTSRVRAHGEGLRPLRTHGCIHHSLTGAWLRAPRRLYGGQRLIFCPQKSETARLFWPGRWYRRLIPNMLLRKSSGPMPPGPSHLDKLVNSQPCPSFFWFASAGSCVISVTSRHMWMSCTSEMYHLCWEAFRRGRDADTGVCVGPCFAGEGGPDPPLHQCDPSNVRRLLEGPRPSRAFRTARKAGDPAIRVLRDHSAEPEAVVSHPQRRRRQ